MRPHPTAAVERDYRSSFFNRRIFDDERHCGFRCDALRYSHWTIRLDPPSWHARSNSARRAFHCGAASILPARMARREGLRRFRTGPQAPLPANEIRPGPNPARGGGHLDAMTCKGCGRRCLARSSGEQFVADLGTLGEPGATRLLERRNVDEHVLPATIGLDKSISLG